MSLSESLPNVSVALAVRRYQIGQKTGEGVALYVQKRRCGRSETSPF